MDRSVSWLDSISSGERSRFEAWPTWKKDSALAVGESSGTIHAREASGSKGSSDRKSIESVNHSREKK